MSTRTPVPWVIWRVASIPSITGIRTSIKITSGRACRAFCTASAPLPASPTTARPGVAAMIPQNPTRTRAWSSATTTRMAAGPVIRRGAAAGCAPARRSRCPAAARR